RDCAPRRRTGPGDFEQCVIEAGRLPVWVRAVGRIDVLAIERAPHRTLRLLERRLDRGLDGDDRVFDFDRLDVLEAWRALADLLAWSPRGDPDSVGRQVRRCGLGLIRLVGVARRDWSAGEGVPRDGVVRINRDRDLRWKAGQILIVAEIDRQRSR